MSAREVMMFGGPLDGQVVVTDAPYFRAAVPSPVSLQWYPHSGTGPEFPTVEYRIDQLAVRLGDSGVSVWVGTLESDEDQRRKATYMLYWTVLFIRFARSGLFA